MDHVQCVEMYKKIYAKFGENQICAGGEPGKDACYGDSGGPLMHTFKSSAPNSVQQWYEEGVVSRGIGCGIENNPAIYTKVSQYLEWIAQNMRD